MSSRLRTLAALALLLANGTPSYADVAMPASRPCIFGWFGRSEEPRPPRPVRPPLENPERDLTIVRDPNAKEAELRIPRHMLVADVSTDSTRRTAMAGLALSAAVVAGGLWCIGFRGNKIPRSRVAAAGALGCLLAASLAFAGFADANAPAWRADHITEKLGDIDVRVTIVDDGAAMQLILPPELADKIAAR